MLRAMFLIVPMRSTSSDSPRVNAVIRIVGPGITSAIHVVLLFLSLSVLIAHPSFAAEQNLLLNGDLSSGTADMPHHWTMTTGAPPFSFEWSHQTGEPPALEIAGTSNHARDDYWVQSAYLAQAGWYRLRAEFKTENSDTQAAIKISGARGTALVLQASRNWAPVEVYFKVIDPNEVVEIGCGVVANARSGRTTPGGRAFFRNLMLSRIFGAPPTGSRQLDFDRNPAGLIAQFFQTDLGAQDGGVPSQANINDVQVPISEKMALLDVEVAKPSLDESLIGDVLNFRVVAAVIFILAALTFLDWRYSSEASSEAVQRGFLQNREVRKSAGIAALLTLTLLGTWLVTRIEYVPGHAFYVVEPHTVGGDEPHYLVMINSLLLKHDLQLQTVYEDVDQGGPEAGVVFSGIELDRHTIVVSRRTGRRAMSFMEASKSDRNPELEFAPSRDVYEIPVHPAGFPILVALAVAPLQPSALEVEPYVGFILMLVAWIGIVATYFVGRQVGMSRAWSMLAPSILFAASPWLAYSRSYFAESTIGMALILGLWAFMSDLPVVAALTAAAGAVMKPPFALVEVGFLVEEVRAKRWKNVVKIAIGLGLLASVILAHNLWLHKRFLVLSVDASFQLRRLVKTLFDSVEGLFVYAPWAIFGFLACARAFLSPSDDGRLARTMALPLFFYLLVVSSLGFGPGWCYGPRYWVAFLPWLALGSVEAIRRAGRYQRAVYVVFGLYGFAIAIPGALRYPQLFFRPVLDAWRGFY